MDKKSLMFSNPIKTILFFLLIGSLDTFAQKAPVILDTTFLKCEYATNYYTDTLMMGKGTWMSDEFILQIGTKISKYYSKASDIYERVQSDPKAKEAYNRELQLAVEKSRKNGGFMNKEPLARNNPLVIYNNYPKNKRTIQNAVFFDYYIFEDDNLPQQWTLLKDPSKKILGYKCKKATCTYRGRKYEAWYTPDIPVSAGPWKFSGLPGLIMNVQDTKGHYTFEIKGLVKTGEPIEYLEYAARKYSRTDRKTFLKTNAKSNQIGIIRYMRANSPNSANNSDFQPTGGGAKYDLLERDY